MVGELEEFAQLFVGPLSLIGLTTTPDFCQDFRADVLTFALGLLQLHVLSCTEVVVVRVDAVLRGTGVSTHQHDVATLLHWGKPVGQGKSHEAGIFVFV